jgi:hypothetical protein
VNNFSVDTTLSRGKFFTIATIATLLVALAAILVMFYLTEDKALASLGTWLHVDFIVCCCLSLYFGSNWPKWIIGLYCIFLSGFIFKIHLFSHFVFHLKSLIMIVWALTAISLSLLLMFSNSVVKYLNYQYKNRKITIQKILKLSWILFLVVIIIIFISDIHRLFFSS